MKRLAVAVAILIVLPACRRQVAVGDAPPPRIVSFCPALTTMLFDMGLGGHVVGVTTQDALPAGVARPVVGDAFSVNAEAVLSARPDILVTNINVQHFAAVRKLDPNIRIEHFTLETLDDVGEALERIATIAGKPQKGQDARKTFQDALERVRQRVAGKPRPKVLFLTDFQNLGTAGRGTFIDQMIQVAGGVNVAEKYTGWTTMTAEGILAAAPEVLICQVAAGAEAERAMTFFQGLKDLPAVQAGRVHLVTDRRWTIPSAVLASFTAELADMIHPSDAIGDWYDR
jgi:iron complex transport system substrate-binding protein